MRAAGREDYVIQSMPDASPVKWHLAHTTGSLKLSCWRRTCRVIGRSTPNSAVFNSYYQAVGPRWPRPQRGLLSRPTVVEVFGYRAAWTSTWTLSPSATPVEVAGDRAKSSLGLHHEQQHQELVLTDLNTPGPPTLSIPSTGRPDARRGAPPRRAWLAFPAGLAWIGHDGGGFAFDNESPRHRIWLHGFHLASRLVTNAEYLAFVGDGGYDRPELWLSDGWAARQAQGWEAPLYWAGRAGSGSSPRWRARDLSSGRAGLSRQLLRGRRFRPLGRRPAAHRGGVGSRRRDASPWEGTSWKAAACTPRSPLRRTTAARSTSFTATCGSGPRVPTSAIPATGPPPAPWASTTANSCATSWSCGALRAPRLGATPAGPTAISSPRTRAGSSAASAWPRSS